MPDTTEAAPVPATLRTCGVCDVRLIGGTPVGLVERRSAPSLVLYACGICLRHHNLLPLDEQEQPYGDGRLQFRETHHDR